MCVRKKAEKEEEIFEINGWLVFGVLWHINLSRLFNAKSIFIEIISPISNNSV